MADVAVVFHWPPAAMEAMALSDLMGWRDRRPSVSLPGNPNETLMADRNLRLQVILEGLDRLTSPLRSITGASAAARQDLARTHEQLKALDAQQQQVGRYKAAETRYGRRAPVRGLAGKAGRLRQQLRDRARRSRAEKKRRAPDRPDRARTGRAALEQGGPPCAVAAGLPGSTLDARHEERLATRRRRHHPAPADRPARQGQRRPPRVGEEISSKATGMGLSAIAAGTATAAPLVVATKQAMTLESAMADVRKVVNFPPRPLPRCPTTFWR
jgi:hypothetical protein